MVISANALLWEGNKNIKEGLRTSYFINQVIHKWTFCLHLRTPRDIRNWGFVNSELTSWPKSDAGRVLVYLPYVIKVKHFVKTHSRRKWIISKDEECSVNQTVWGENHRPTVKMCAHEPHHYNRAVKISKMRGQAAKVEACRSNRNPTADMILSLFYFHTFSLKPV